MHFPLRMIFAAAALALAPAAGWAKGPADETAVAAAPAPLPADEPLFRPEGVRAHVDFLADDLLEGRKAGSRGYAIAAKYVATQFEALGLKQGGDGGSWFQQVPLAKYGLDPASPATLSVGEVRFRNGSDVLIAPNPRTGNTPQRYRGGAVFLGYGLERDYAGVDVKDRFAVVLMGMPSDAPADMGTQDKAEIAGRHGALGVLYVVTPDDLKGSGWGEAAAHLLSDQVNWLSPGGVPGGDRAPIQVGAYVNSGVADALFAGSPISAARLFAAVHADQPFPTGFALARPVSIARTTKVTRFDSPNVIAVLPGSDPVLAKEYVVLSAHLDHEGTRPAAKGEDGIFNGAMDNAAGVATMLEVARGFTQSGKRPKRSILFVALTAEERGLLGSGYLAHYPVKGGRPVADVNLDMPMLLYDFTDVVAFGAEHSTLGPIVERAAGRMGVKLSPDPMPEEQLFLRSDHYSFVQQGVPSVFLVTGFANGGEKAFRDFLAHHYHQVSDDISLPFDWQAGAKFARLNYLIAREIADAPVAPRWYEGNVYGDKFAPGQPRAKRP